MILLLFFIDIFMGKPSCVTFLSVFCASPFSSGSVWKKFSNGQTRRRREKVKMETAEKIDHIIVLAHHRADLDWITDPDAQLLPRF